jgi:hypothetical protein
VYIISLQKLFDDNILRNTIYLFRKLFDCQDSFQPSQSFQVGLLNSGLTRARHRCRDRAKGRSLHAALPRRLLAQLAETTAPSPHPTLHPAVGTEPTTLERIIQQRRRCTHRRRTARIHPTRLADRAFPHQAESVHAHSPRQPAARLRIALPRSLRSRCRRLLAPPLAPPARQHPQRITRSPCRPQYRRPHLPVEPPVPSLDAPRLVGTPLRPPRRLVKLPHGPKYRFRLRRPARSCL